VNDALQGTRARGAWPAAKRLGAAAAAALALAGASEAHAFYGNGAQIVSADFGRLEQADDASTFAAISGDGRYVAIQTRARNFFADDDPDPPGQYRAGGIFRFDLATRALAKVADGDLFAEAGNAFLRRGASNPSISADGRYVAFATAEPLVAADANDNVDVYVRDMALPDSDAAAFDLVSARDGGGQPAGYGPPAFPFPGSNPGSDVSRGVAISADGQRVVFRTDAPSDLPAAAAADVPAGQLLLRDRVADTTTLVTRAAAGGGPAGGAIGGALSADGSTVAWTGSNAAAQTRFLDGENEEASFLYYLWRRVADGPAAATRRITGLADPDDPACPPDATTTFDQVSTGPCFGPLTDQEANRSGISGQLPALSGDGRRVAFLTGSGPRPLAFTSPGLDLFVTDMTTGVSRKQATAELTRDTVGEDAATSPPISSIALSRDGRYIALTTVRTRFALAALTLLGSPRAVPGPRELYVADLDQRTLDRVTRSTAGGDIDADVLNGVSLSADGGRVAFVSFAANLFFGDANQRADAFVATRTPAPLPQPPTSGPEDDGPAGTIVEDRERSGPRIAVRARPRRDGSLLVSVTVPAAGGVKAVARARAGRPRRQRVLATGSARARKRGRVRIVLRPVRRYRAELRRRGAIPARVAVTFVASRGGRRATARVRTTVRAQRRP
jgi:hypothetical protein